jgi:hypothetical protein
MVTVLFNKKINVSIEVDSLKEEELSSIDWNIYLPDLLLSSFLNKISIDPL